MNFLVIALVVFPDRPGIASMRRVDEAIASPEPQAQLALAITLLVDALENRQI